MAKSKSGSFFQKFFKLIFSFIAVVLAIVAISFAFTPFVSSEITVLGITVGFYFSGFGIAFPGDGTLSIASNTQEINLPSDVSQLGTQIAMYLLFAGAVLAIIYLLFSWGKKGTTLSKSIGAISTIALLVAGVLIFLTLPLCGFEDITFSSYTFAEVNLGYGAITSGIACLLGALSMGIATFLAPKND